MADRSVEVRLGLDVSDFEAGAKRAGSALGDVGSKTESLGKESQSAFQKATQHVKTNASEYRTLGAAMAGVGAAMTAASVAVAKTGIEYNMLQQSSRAALGAIMGSGERANAQMDKLDAFARTSPFAKQGFIEAQRTMIGFGIESQKVVPYLDAIQNATAAIGGSNTDIAQIVDVFAKVKSQGKLTARELMQLGVHGIDAATLIGDAMGKTGDQIRNDITAGALDADTALDALAEGMQGRFGGAAEAVKEQFEGALDRVKAAFRDFSSSAMEPFVDPKGGGLLVDWTNSFADLIRLMDRLPGPAKTGITVISGLGGAALTAGGGFLMLAPRVVETVEAVRRLRESSAIIDGFAGSLGKIGKAGMVVAGLAAVTAGMRAIDLSGNLVNTSSLDDFARRLENTSDAGLQFERAFTEIDWYRSLIPVGITDSYDSMGDALNRLINPSNMERLADFAGALNIFSKNRGWQDAEAARRVLDEANDAIAQLVASGNIEQAQAAWQALSSEWVAAGGDLDRLKELMPEAAAALGSGADEAGEAASRWEDAAAGIEAYKEALLGLSQWQDQAADSVFRARDALRDWTDQTSEATEKGLRSAQAADDYAQATKKTAQEMLYAVDANGNFVYSLDEVMGVMNDGRGVLESNSEAAYGNADAWQHLAEMVGLTPEWVETHYVLREQVLEELQPILAALDGLPPEVVSQILMMGEADALSVISAIQFALDEGVPPEKISDILVNDLATEPLHLVLAAIQNLPDEHNTDINAEDNTGGPTSSAKGNIKSVPPMHNTDLLGNDMTTHPTRTATRNINAVPGSKTSTLTAIDDASGTLENIRAGIAGIQSKSVTISVIEQRMKTATGHSLGALTTAKNRATGGPIYGPGHGTSDDIPVWLSRDEHVLTAREVRAVGGHAGVYALRQAVMDGNLRLAEGGRPGLPMPVSPAAPQRTTVTPPDVTVYVQNPFTGKEVEARVARTVVKYL